MTSIPANRLATLASALNRDLPSGTAPEQRVADLIDSSSPAEVWLAIAVLSGRLPTDDHVNTAISAARSDPGAVYRFALDYASPTSLTRDVRVVTDRVLVDVAHTVTTTLTSGIQRVVRECAKRWAEKPETLFIQFVGGELAYRTLTPAERHCLLTATMDRKLDNDPAHCEIIVPWNTAYFCPELPADYERGPTMRGLSRCSPNFVGIIGHDAIPITTGETTVPDMPGRFASFLSALRDADLVIATCQSSANEFRGWREMVRAHKHQGPDVEIVRLPVESVDIAPDILAERRRKLTLPGVPMILVVGSHEPRKNHLSVLYAAERLWTAGEEFSLVFIGGHSWKSEEFFAEAKRLQKAGWPLELLTAVNEELLWSAYRLARFTVFPSLNEGFGLPVAESLAADTPVITSNFGSMAEIAADGGALLVDPRDDDSIIAGMRELLRDDELLADLRAQARLRANRTWEQYATEVWETLQRKAQEKQAATSLAD